MKATDGFSRIFDISSNGAIYKAKFQNGQAAIIKEIRVFDDLDDYAFYRKVQLLGHLHHRHIVALSGFSTGHKRSSEDSLEWENKATDSWRYCCRTGHYTKTFLSWKSSDYNLCLGSWDREGKCFVSGIGDGSIQ